MDPNSSLGKICLGDDVIVISSDKVEGSGDWNSPEYQDTTVSKGKKVMNALSFYKMEISERYTAPCFVNGLEAFDGEVNLAFDENLISNEFTVKLCLVYEVKKGKNLVKKELIVALKGELYFVKFIINPEKDDFEPGVILGRSFLRLAQGVVDFGNGVITIYPEPDPFEEESEKTGKSSNDWDQLLDFNFDDVPKSGEELPPFVCKMGKSNRNKKRAMENLNLFYQDIGPSSSAGRHLTQEEAAKEELAIRISQRYALLEEERPVIETMAYNDKYKKILDEIWKDKVELDGKTVKEDEEAVKRIKGEALKEKDDPGAFIFPIRLEGKVNENALADTGSDINTMPYRIFETVTTIIAKFLILDIPIDRDALIVAGQGFHYTMGRMEIRQDAIERMEYRQSYHWDIYHGVFEHMISSGVSSPGARLAAPMGEPTKVQYLVRTIVLGMTPRIRRRNLRMSQADQNSHKDRCPFTKPKEPTRSAKRLVLIGEIEALGARGMAVGCLKQTQARETDKLATLTDLLVETQAGIHEKEGHVAKMDLND
ncbi:hypothetical protein Tco_0567379 [Tanacetum coccineum]